MLTSDLHQSCAITGEAIPVQVRDKFDILFIPKADPSELEEEIELTEEECDLVEYEKSQIDLGEAILFVARMPASVCVNEILISPTWNRAYVGNDEPEPIGTTP